MAILGAAAARGWQLTEVRGAVDSGAWKGLAGLYQRRSEPGRMERLLPLEWRKCVGRISGEENVRHWHTSDLSTRPPAGEAVIPAEYGHTRQWMTAVDCAAEDPQRVRNWGRRATAVRLVLLALGQAAMVSGSSVVEFGCRNLALYSAVSHRTVARVLRLLAAEDDPLIDLVSPRRMARADRYQLRIPDRYATVSAGDVGELAGSRRSTRCSWSSAVQPGWCTRRSARSLRAALRWPGQPGSQRRLPRPRSGCSLSTGSPSEAKVDGLAGPSPRPTSPSRQARLTCSGSERSDTGRTGKAGEPGCGSTRERSACP